MVDAESNVQEQDDVDYEIGDYDDRIVANRLMNE